MKIMIIVMPFILVQRKKRFLETRWFLCCNLTMAEPRLSQTLTPAWQRTRPYASEHCIIKVSHIFTLLKDEFWRRKAPNSDISKIMPILYRSFFMFWKI